jgi:hypothetical protein
MGYYENPPIINLNSGYEKIAAGAASAANSIAEALIKRGDRKREEEKEQKLTIKKLQEEKNKVDLYYNDYISNWSKDQPQGNPIADQTKTMLQQKIQGAADARIALTMESDPAKRSDYLKIIRDAEGFMDVAGKFGKSAAGEILTYKQTPGIAMNTPGGWAVNASDENLGKMTDTLNILSGMTQDYESKNIELIDLGGTFAVKVSGKKKTGETFENVINANDYLNSDGSGTGGFLQKVENVDEFRNQSLKSIVDPKSKQILPGFLGVEMETVKLPSKGGNSYEIIGAKRLNEDAIRSKIKEEANIKAAGYIKGGDTASTRALINSTLGMGPTYYDRNFKGIIDPDKQKEELAKLLEENAFKSFVNGYETTVENGKTIYWGGDGKVRMVPKETKGIGKTSLTGAKESGSNSVFSEDQIDQYMESYKALYNNPDGQFVVEIQGPRGGVREETFYVDPKSRKIVSDKSNVGFTPTSFKKYLRSKKTKPALRG